MQSIQETRREAPPASADSLFHADRGVRIWLIACCALITAMVTIGGITRLTGSGLSITDWAPIMGAIPPLNEADWNAAFAKYREIPQFKLVNPDITLSGFKFLFFWEWFHRLVGRSIGLVTFLPGIWFYATKRISRRLALRVLLGIVLGGLQGALGWFMVKSGLSERVSVSHFRLAAHLSLALVILSYFVWLTLSVFLGDRPVERDQLRARAFLRPRLAPYLALIGLQIVYGAFVAGMKAGYGFNTFPLMDGMLVPRNLLAFEPAWVNAFENPATLQWIHRSLGWLVFFSSLGLWLSVRARAPRGEIRRPMTGLAHLVFVQFLLGVGTLLTVVSLPFAVLHQLGAAMVVVFATWLAHAMKRPVSS
jgi:cytochrome c oxidase assembly protein subunit 15